MSKVIMSTNRRTLLATAAFAGLMFALPAAAQDCTVRIGAVGPFTGAAAGWGLAAKTATEFVAARINAEGGLQMGDRQCEVVVESFDAQYTAAGGAAAANYMESVGVHAVVGPVGSPETTGFRPVAARSGIVNIAPSYSRDVITPEFPLAFHGLQAPVTWGPFLVRRARDVFHLETVMIIAPNDQGGTDAGHQLEATYQGADVGVTMEYYQRGTTNFAPIAARVMLENPDGVEISTLPPGDAAIFVQQLLEAGFEGTIGSLGGGGLGPIVEGAGGAEELTNVYWLEITPSDHPGLAQLREDYRQLMGDEMPGNALFPIFVINAEVVMDAVRQAGTDADGEAIATAMRALTPTSHYFGSAGWRGITEYGINHELTFPPGLGLIINGERQPTEAVEIPTEQG
ncbi:MAG: ABC transporter substrate-binding protein [Rhodobacteraceae bacterium]|nr:ABC transporter substrate-binding protein [Paracoccaceae bacterium]